MTNHTSKMTIEYMLFVHENWHFYLAATKGSLCFVGTNGSDFEELSQWVHKHYFGYPLVDNPAALSLYAEEFHAYFERKSTSFTFHATINGTPFQKKVWKQLQQIPYGETRTYKEIAHEIGHPNAVRAVGTAIGKNPLLIVVPCHRVIRTDGNLSGYRGGLSMKTHLLELEKNFD